MSSGKIIESHLQQLCERLFFPDFTVRARCFPRRVDGRRKRLTFSSRLATAS